MFSPVRVFQQKNQVKKNKPDTLDFLRTNLSQTQSLSTRGKINGTIKSTVPRVDSYALSIQVRNSTTVFTRTTIFQISWHTSIKVFGKFLFSRTTIFQNKNKTTHTVTKK